MTGRDHERAVLHTLKTYGGNMRIAGRERLAAARRLAEKGLVEELGTRKPGRAVGFRLTASGYRVLGCS